MASASGHRAGRHRAVRAADRRHHGQHLRRLGDADRGGVGRLPVRLLLCLIWGDLTWRAVHRRHAPHRADLRQPAVHHLFSLYLRLRDRRRRRGGSGDVLAGRPAPVALPVLRRAVRALHGARMPRGKHRHDRDHRAADLSGAGNYGIDPIWFGVDPGDVRGTRPDLAADRDQPVRHPEHLGRRTQRRGDGNDPVPHHHVRAAVPVDGVSRNSRSGCPARCSVRLPPRHRWNDGSRCASMGFPRSWERAPWTTRTSC